MAVISRILSAIILFAIPLALLAFMFVSAGTCGLAPNGCPELDPFLWSGIAVFIVSIPASFFISLKSNKSKQEKIIALSLYILPLVVSVLLFLGVILSQTQ